TSSHVILLRLSVEYRCMHLHTRKRHIRISWLSDAFDGTGHAKCAEIGAFRFAEEIEAKSRPVAELFPARTNRSDRELLEKGLRLGRSVDLTRRNRVGLDSGAVGIGVGVLVGPKQAAREIDPGKNATRSRIRQDLRRQLSISRGCGRAADWSSRN